MPYTDPLLEEGLGHSCLKLLVKKMCVCGGRFTKDTWDSVSRGRIRDVYSQLLAMV